ncbi:hypothetical protein A2V71_00880 [Candidatus Berkelbacteria bacterium RBG_13_40_8]|uniref:50S ribosomal protein L18 n=1 Tax=Candidatus Berkelbacteria bacterium RBG_13_40_8 TaxID=1797467 RepID=A0A1F5DQP9_9BACT|nr:MAG: hypothetical protein A2V71_00880 [Candidatus Berkelbacteria bacterium RBG_13_40_8]
MLEKTIKTIRRARSKISGTKTRPRLAVFRSLKGVSCQLIDDEKGATLAYVKGKNPEEVGKELAKKAAELKIKEAVFDRRAYKYHGKIKTLCEAARAGGLKI